MTLKMKGPKSFDTLRSTLPITSSYLKDPNLQHYLHKNCRPHAGFILLQFDAEILFWEGKTHEQQHQMEFMSQEASRIEVVARLGEEQVCVPIFPCGHDHS